jgi:hypothetical protein
MEIEAQKSDRLTLRLADDEIDHWNNALNEVCNGFAVANFQAAIGISEQSAKALLEKIRSIAPGQSELFLLDELLAVRNALTMVLVELDPREFHPRMGFTVEESKQMRNTLDSLAGQIRFVNTA